MRLGRDRKKKQEKGKEKKVKGILRKMENSKGTRFCALTIFWDVAEKGGGFEIIKGEREKGNKKRKKGKLGREIRKGKRESWELLHCFSVFPAAPPKARLRILRGGGMFFVIQITGYG